MKSCFPLLLLLLSPLAVSAQNGWYNFNPSNSGLLDGRIACAVQDRSGDFWIAYSASPFIGTMKIGAAKFDGEKWQNFGAENTGVPLKSVQVLARDSSGNIWFGMYSGLAKFDGTDWTAYTIDNSGIAGYNIKDIEFDRKGNVWIAMDGGMQKFDGTTWTIYNYDDPPFADHYVCPTDLLIDNADNLWVAMDCQGVAVLNTQTNTWTSYTPRTSSLPAHSVNSLAQDQSGNIWMGFGLRNLIARFDGANFTTYRPFADGNYVRDGGLAIDAAGNVWCGTYAEGLWKFNGETWNRIEMMPDSMLISSTVHSVFIDADDNIWWAAQTHGLWTNSPQYASGVKTETEEEGTLYAMPNPFTDRTTLCLANEESGRKEALLFDCAGKLVRRISSGEGEEIRIDREGLSAGLYLVQVRTEDGIIASEKLIVE